MKKLQSSRASKSSRQTYRTLPSVCTGQNTFLKQPVSCAFHQGEKITNFCKDKSCLLPLCPKCIKIHSEQHAKMGVFSSFATIDQCLEQAHTEYVKLFSDISKLQQISFDLEESYRKNKQQMWQEFNTAKSSAHDYLENIFKEYEEGLKLQLSRDDQQFSENLLQYHEYINYAMDNCKNGATKMSNRNLLMEAIISFYQNGSLREGIEECERKLHEFTINKISISTKQYELERFTSIVKRYIHFGDTPNRFEDLLNEIKMYKSFEMGDKKRQPSIAQGKTFLESPRSIDLHVTKEPSKIETMQSPLDRYSLERSRNMRIAGINNTQ